MRQPPSPLLLSARKRRPRRNPPRGAQAGSQFGSADQGQPQQAQGTPEGEKCVLLERAPGYTPPREDDDDSSTSSR